MVADRNGLHTKDQATAFFFEIAKHFTTLNTAAILVFLAVSREADLPLWIAGLFVFSLIGAVVSMLVTGLIGVSGNRYAVGNIGMAVAVAGFFVGLLYSIFHSIMGA